MLGMDVVTSAPSSEVEPPQPLIWSVVSKGRTLCRHAIDIQIVPSGQSSL
jgi:hypothetical protein